MALFLGLKTFFAMRANRVVSGAIDPPVNSVVPSISGNAYVGQTLTATTGTWLNEPLAYSYQWKAAGANVGTDQSTYAPVSGDVDKTITVTVTASNAAGAGTPATSSATAAVIAVPANTVLPAISGTETVGQTLSVSTGTWSGGGSPSYAYQWRRDGVDIGGATANTHLLVTADAGKVITCRVTATNAAGATSATSAGTGAIFGDIYIANVVMLLGFEGADGSTTLTDESTTANKGAGTANGNAQIDTAQFKFGASSGLFDGTGDFWSWADHADWDLSDANSDLFTIEFWWRPNANVSSMRVLGHSGAPNNIGWYMISTATGGNADIAFQFSIDGTSGNGGGVGSSTKNMALGAWHYIAVSKNASGKLRIWRNGTLDASGTPANSAIFNSTNAFEVGRSNNFSNYNGHLDEVRVTKGVCRFDTDASITVPTAAFPRS